jgi:hypothetical protein
MLNKYLTAHQSLMFVSVEQENHIRANLLKRLAFIIYSGEFDQYLSSLPIIQEKLVEALKVPQASFVYIQVFLCMRVLLTRMSRDKLRAFWPVILTEMVRSHLATFPLFSSTHLSPFLLFLDASIW